MFLTRLPAMMPLLVEWGMGASARAAYEEGFEQKPEAQHCHGIKDVIQLSIRSILFTCPLAHMVYVRLLGTPGGRRYH